MIDLTSLTLKAARDGLDAKRFSAVELTQAHLDAMTRHRALNASSPRRPTRHWRWRPNPMPASPAARPGPWRGCRWRSRTCSARRARPTTAGSHILDGFVPPYESTVSQKLWDAGAVFLGKTNLDEFAMGSSNETSYYKGVRNPWTRAGTTPTSCRAAVPAARPAPSRRACASAPPAPIRGLDPPARRLHRHLRHQADLRPLLAPGHRRVRLLARSGGGRWRVR